MLLIITFVSCSQDMTAAHTLTSDAVSGHTECMAAIGAAQQYALSNDERVVAIVDELPPVLHL